MLVGAVTLAATLLVLRYGKHGHHAENGADVLCAHADDLSWNNRWLDADPLYAQAEYQFLRQGESEKALYAHVSRLIVRADSEPIAPLLLELQRDLSLPEATNPETHLRILVIKGMIETNYDAALARDTWGQVQILAKRRRHYLLLARAAGEQGIAAFILGDVGTAKKLVLRAWLAAKYLGDDAAHVRYASVYGAGLVELERYNDALKALDEAINTASHSQKVAYPSIAVNAKIDALRGLRNYPEALALADEAIRRLPATHLDAHLYQILTSKGEVYGDEENRSSAIAQYTAAMEYARHLGYWRGVVQTGGLLAKAYENEGKLSEGLKVIDEAIEANQRIPQELYFSPRNLAIKAELLDNLGKQKQSRMLHEKSLRLFDALLASAPTPNTERELLNQMREVYSRYFESLCREGHLDLAFATIERAHGRIEAQALSERPSLVPHDPTADEKRIEQLDLDILKNDDPKTGTELERALVESRLLLGDTTLSGLTSHHPVPLLAVQAHLRANELLLEYVLDEPQSSVLAITATSAHRYELIAGKELGTLAAQYRKTIHNRKTDDALGRRLFEQLLAPVVEYRLKPEVIVVPDGELHLLPFASLIENGRYTLVTHSFSVTPSASVLAMLRSRPQTQGTTPSYIGVAASDNSEQGKPIVAPVSFSDRADSLRPLPSSKKEVQTIASYFHGPSLVLLGADATESRFKSLPLNTYNLIHLALHGHADIEYSDRSALLFAPDPGGKDDGVLDVREIRQLRLKASLVTLSSCDTGVGPISEADVANLANAFIEAGAQSVVASLWDIEDQTTAQLMTLFYKNLSLHENKANALRDAQLHILEAGLPPYYWASVEVLGDASGSVA